jgi:hypothetical protein
VLTHAEVAKHASRLQHRADAAGLDRVLRRSSEERDRPLVRLLQAEEHVDGRRLARAVRTQERDGLARAHGDVDPAHRMNWPAR